MSSTGNNPFLDDDEVDDFEFLSHHPQGQSGYLLGEDKSGQNSDWALRQQLLLEEKRKIEDRTLQSTVNSLAMVHESEQVGISTAEELMCQREQLQNVEKNLDKISDTMRISQKHINSLKSMFGGIKSYFSGGNNTETKKNTVVSPTSPQSASSLHKTLGNLKEGVQPNTKYDLHPALRTRGINYENEDEFDSAEVSKQHPSIFESSGSGQDYESKFNQNLEDLSSGLGRLKHLAIGLNEEIVDQNVMLESIAEKAVRSDDVIQYQNSQIKRILKK